jgi:transposase-like protein
MSRKKHVVDLSDEERRTLEWFISTGERKAEDNTRARILLKADDGLTDAEICEHVGCSIGTPYKARKNYSERGIAAIHRRKPDREYERKLDGMLKHASSNSPVATHQKGALVGRFTFSPTNSSPSTRSTLSRSLTKP